MLVLLIECLEEEKGKDNVKSSRYRSENISLLSSLMSRCTNPTPCIHPTALHNSHHILFNTDSPTGR